MSALPALALGKMTLRGIVHGRVSHLVDWLDELATHEEIAAMHGDEVALLIRDAIREAARG